MDRKKIKFPERSTQKKNKNRVFQLYKVLIKFKFQKKKKKKKKLKNPKFLKKIQNCQ